MNNYGYIYDNIDYYNLKRKRIILIVFDDMNADVMTNKTFQNIINRLFLYAENRIISCIYRSLKVPKDIN